MIKSKNSKIKGNIFNAGGNYNNFNKKGIVQLIKKNIKKTNVSYKKFDVDPRNYKVDFSKVRKTLGFKPRYSVEYGIKEIINALREKKLKFK